MLSALIDMARRALSAAQAHGDHHGDHEREPEPAPTDPLALVVDQTGWLRLASGLDSVALRRVPSPRHQALVTHDAVPAGIVWHWTATRAGTAEGLVRSIARPVPAGGRAASWHVLVDRQGRIHQSVPLRRGSWHAGGPTAARFGWADVPGKPGLMQYGILKGAKLSANGLFVGVELENAGEVRSINGRWRAWPFDRDGGGPEIPADQVRRVGPRYYHDFPDAQVEAAARLVRAFVGAYGGDRRSYGGDRRSLSWTHAEIDPTRKTDPGPLWADHLLPKVLHDAGVAP